MTNNNARERVRVIISDSNVKKKRTFVAGYHIKGYCQAYNKIKKTLDNKSYLIYYQGLGSFDDICIKKWLYWDFYHLSRRYLYKIIRLTSQLHHHMGQNSP